MTEKEVDAFVLTYTSSPRVPISFSVSVVRIPWSRTLVQDNLILTMFLIKVSFDAVDIPKEISKGMMVRVKPFVEPAFNPI
jgi:hypothetical protein